MKKTNLNFIYNIIYQVFILIVPLVSMPYISRNLGVDNIGVYSYTYSIVNYFMLFSMLGINNYGSREIAVHSNNKEERSQCFWEIYGLQCILTIVMLIIYLLVFVNIFSEFKLIMLIQGINLLSVIFDINWFFFGVEKFKITISRNIFIKIGSLIFIFLYVKQPTDLWKYTLIMSLSLLISQLYLWFHIKKYILIVPIKLQNVIRILPKCIILFIPVIAYSIYRVMDKTLIGYLSNTFELGNYESAEKIINIPLSFITALGTVMVPHMSKLDNKEFNKEIIKTFQLSFCFVIPMALGMYVISDDFSILFFGDEFYKVSNIIKLLVPTIIFSSISNVVRTNYLIPKSADSIYVKSTLIGALINLICNLLLIEKMGAYGACVGTVMAELAVTLYQIIKTRQFIEYKKVLYYFIQYFFKSILMVIPVIVIGFFIKNQIIKIIIQIIIGVSIYFLANYKYILYDFIGLKKQ